MMIVGWVKQCVTLEVEGAKQRVRLRKTCKRFWTRTWMTCI